MKFETTMIRGNSLVKNILVLLVPTILSGVLAFQILTCGNILNRRNSYLLEDLPERVNWVWDALGGHLYPHLYSKDDQPGGIHANRLKPFALPAKDGPNKFDLADKKAEWFKGMKDIQKDYREAVLIPGIPSLTVHFLWCADGHFEMSHYITILSALHQFRPDKMIIHYLKWPRTDPHGYWRWLEDLERNIIMLSLKPLHNSRHCGHDLSAGVEEDDFPGAHGIFLLGDVAITNLTRPDVIKLIAQSFLGKKSEKIHINDLVEEKWSKSQVFIVSNSEPFHVSQSPGRAVITCPPMTEFNSVKNLIDISCVSMQTFLYLEEVLQQETRFFRYVRTLLYGSPKPMGIPQGQGSSIPKIFHVVLGEDSCKITPLIYVSIKSAYQNGNMETVYVHCGKKPVGELWDRLFYSDHLSPIFVPTGSFVKESPKNARMSYMLYILFQHGGIGSIGDAIFVKPMSQSSLSALAVASIHRSQYRQKHRTLNTAVLASVSGSEFIQKMLSQSANSWSDMNLDDIASHLSETNPHSILIDSQLTSHQQCEGNRCIISAGHDPPQMVFTTRLIWKNNEPKTLEELSVIQGPFMRELHQLAR